MTQTELTQYVADNNLSSKSLVIAKNPQFQDSSRIVDSQTHFGSYTQTLDLKISEKGRNQENRLDIPEYRSFRNSNYSSQTPNFHRQSRLVSEHYPETETIEVDEIRQEMTILVTKKYDESSLNQIDQDIQPIDEGDEDLLHHGSHREFEQKTELKSGNQDSQTEIRSVSTITGKSSNAKKKDQTRRQITHEKDFFIPSKFEHSPLPDAIKKNSRKQSGEINRISSRSKKYSGERNLSKDQIKDRILERMKESREGPRTKVSNKQLHKIYH